jgi:ribosomal protein S18 acetylase RimI-like enzyme
MVDIIYGLFKNTLPDIIRNEETVREILNDSRKRIITRNEGEQLAGVSVVGGNVIYLLCVDAGFQRKGIGTSLLRQSEEYIASQGFNKVKLGAGDNYIMPGVPMNRNAHEFFKRHGYVHAWGGSGCFDMSRDLTGNVFCEQYVGDTIDGVEYRWATEGDMGQIIRCVADAEENFVQYYKSDDTPVIVAVKDGEVVGTLMVGVDGEGEGIGSVGCTTTMKKYRGRGIATNMVRLGTKHLREAGLPKAFLGYTYTEIVNMYGRAGYEICMEYFMGEKEL